MASAGYHLRTALECLRQSPLSSLIATATVAVSLSVCGLVLSAARTLESTLEGIGAQASLTVFLPEDVSPETGLDWAQKAAEAAGHGARAVFVTPEQSLDRLAGELGSLGSALGALVVNPLPPTLEVMLDPGRVSERGLVEVREAAARVQALPFAGDLDWGEGLVERLELLLLALEATGLLVFALVLLMTFVLVDNVVRLAIHGRRDEISIQRLVGATDAFIAAPFVIEGSIQGLLGGAGAALVVSLTERRALPSLAALLGFTDTFLAPPLGWSLLLLPLGGLALGLVASFLSSLRFLRSAP